MKTKHTQRKLQINNWFIVSLVLLMALAWLLDKPASADVPVCEAAQQYIIYYELFSELDTERTMALPYTIIGTMYDGGWNLPDGWNQRQTVRYAIVLDLYTGDVHHIRVNEGRWFVMVFHSYDPGADGSPHPVAAWWIEALDY